MYSFEFLTSMVSDADPCGPDLDLAFDDTFMQFMATVDSILPESGKSAKFFEFDRIGAQLAKKIEGMKGLLETTRDLRLLAALAKMQILDRQTENFITTVKAMDFLIAERWQDVHPQAEDGDYTLRINSLEALDDFTQMVLPVQHTTLFRSKRFGPIAYRQVQLSSGAIERREIKEGELEPVIDQGSFEAMIEGAHEGTANDLDIREMVQSREQFTALKDTLTSIQNKSQELLDFRGSIKFERLLALVNDIGGFLEKSITRRDPAQASGGLAASDEDASANDGAPGASSGGAGAPVGSVATLDEVTLALRAVGNYFARHEPSSPALLLVRQAQGLVGRGFFEALRALMPAHAAEASLLMGSAPGFDMSVERLAEVASEYFDPEAPDEEIPADAEPEPDYDEGGQEEAAAEPDADEAGDSEQGASEEPEADPPEDEPLPAAEQPAPAEIKAVRPKVFRAGSRQEAIGLLSAVQKYYVQVEPSSPIPLLIERARAIGSLEFSSLLKLVMPKAAFRSSDDY